MSGFFDFCFLSKSYKEIQNKRGCMSSILTRLIIIGSIGIALINIGYFGASLPYLLRASAAVLGFFLLFIDFVLFRIRQNNTTSYGVQKTLRIRWCLLLIMAGSFLAGAVSGITVYDTHWGVNETLYKLSTSFNVTSSNAEPVYMGILAVGMGLFAVGLIFLANKLSPNAVKPPT
jgi:hypothetical protein